MKPLTITTFYDGRPGHEKQTMGIVDALAAMTPVEINVFRVKTGPSVFLKNWIFYFFSFLEKNKSDELLQNVDLIIGTGTHTHIPMLEAGKKCSEKGSTPARIVTCMTPDPLLQKRFDLCFVPMHDEPAPADNVFMTLGPPTTVRLSGVHQDDRGLILIGGIDEKSHVWKPEEVAGQVRCIIERRPGMTWTISSSPRTPEGTCRDLEKITEKIAHVTFYRSESTPSGWVEKQYEESRSVWVTADSISMVYEALTAGCSVGILPVEWLKKENKFNRSLAYLADRKMIVDFDAWQQGAELPEPGEEHFNEAIRCAREILRRWWPDRLQ